MKVLVTGGGGFLGFQIVKRLVARGDTVIVLGRNVYPHVTQLSAQSVAADICVYDKIISHFEGVEEVYHVAAVAEIWGDWQHFYSINFIGTQNVVKACLEKKVQRLIHTSSPSVVFDGSSQTNLNESVRYPSTWLAHYPHSKMLAEKYVLAANSDRLKTTALRPHLIWGPDDPHIFPRIVKKAKEGRLAIVGTAQNKVDVTYVDNAAQAHILAGHALKETGMPAGKAYFIGQNEPVNLWEFVGKILEREGLAPVKKRLPFFLAYMIGAFFEILYKLFRLKQEPMMTRFVACQLGKDHYYSHENAKKDFGYSAEISIEEGLGRIYGPRAESVQQR
jgi:2-alkyl-3-oxoalkanoate reductase